MKNVLLIATASLLFLLSGCKKDPKPEDLIIGKWSATKLVVDGEDIMAPDPEFRYKVEVEFTKSGILTFSIEETDLTTSPPEKWSYSYGGSYSWNDGKLTLNLTDGSDNLSVRGTAEVTKTRLLFLATSGDTDIFLSLLEADKI